VEGERKKKEKKEMKEGVEIDGGRDNYQSTQYHLGITQCTAIFIGITLRDCSVSQQV
jgi:hypothetical protein